MPFTINRNFNLLLAKNLENKKFILIKLFCSKDNIGQNLEIVMATRGIVFGYVVIGGDEIFNTILVIHSLAPDAIIVIDDAQNPNPEKINKRNLSLADSIILYPGHFGNEEINKYLSEKKKGVVISCTATDMHKLPKHEIAKHYHISAHRFINKQYQHGNGVLCVRDTMDGNAIKKIKEIRKIVGDITTLLFFSGINTSEENDLIKKIKAGANTHGKRISVCHSRLFNDSKEVISEVKRLNEIIISI